MTVFVPGQLTNPLNGSHGHWDKHRRWAKGWREKASFCMLSAWGKARFDPSTPKLIRFTAYVGREWDDDNLRAGLKPIRDALVDMRVIHDDKPSAGHQFLYVQEHAPKSERGVEILVSVL